MSIPDPITTLHLCGRDWPFHVRRHPSARRITLRVSLGGRITLTAPPRISDAAVTAALREARPWLERKLAPLAVQRDRLPNSIRLRAVGEARLVRRDAHACSPLRDDGRVLWLGVEVEDAFAALRDWLKAQGRRHLPGRLTALSRATGLVHGRLSVRHQRTRWGSCNARGDISLNCAILLLPPGALHQLMIHELCHTRVADHSPRFWMEVARHAPDYRRWERYLTSAMGRLPLWARPG